MSSGFHQIYLDKAVKEIPGGMGILKSTWRCSSNIALVKYWGKRDVQIPRNPSLSFSLSKSLTEMKVEVRPAKEKGPSINYFFEGVRKHDFEKRISTYIKGILPFFPFLNYCSIGMMSRNTFPHSSGIASSASSLSALALCICSIEEKIANQGVEGRRGPDFFQKASYMARLGSGSASRSVYGGFVSWGQWLENQISSDEFASALSISVGRAFRNLQDAVLIVNPAVKKISSSQGHDLMDQHPYALQRYEQAARNLTGLLKAIECNDIENFIRITESEALSLHGLMLSSDPGFILLEPATINIINGIREFREKTGKFLTFTIDAGPNVHLIYPETERTAVISFVKDYLERFCYNGQWIDDRMGEGPVELTS